MKRLVIFLIRRKLGLKQFQLFQFINQETKDVYYFTDLYLMVYKNGQSFPAKQADVQLNWLLDDSCEVTYDRMRI